MNRLNISSSKFRSLHSLGKLLTSVLLLVGLCAAHTAQAQTRFSYSADGSEVIDSKTGLVWQRCSAGQSWSAGLNTCTGTAATYTHEAALSFAKIQTGWRLPNVRELSSITDKSLINPAIDVTAFPVTPANLFWTASPYAGIAAYAWYVSFLDGYIYSISRNSSHHVRLVR